MKIKSNLIFNLSLIAAHEPKSKEDRIVIGSMAPESIVIPAGATLELGDNEWKKYAKASEAYLDNGHLVMVVAPKLSKAEQAEADAAELKVLEAKTKSLKAKKAEVVEDKE